MFTRKFIAIDQNYAPLFYVSELKETEKQGIHDNISDKIEKITNYIHTTPTQSKITKNELISRMRDKITEIMNDHHALERLTIDDIMDKLFNDCIDPSLLEEFNQHLIHTTSILFRSIKRYIDVQGSEEKSFKLFCKLAIIGTYLDISQKMPEFKTWDGLSKSMYEFMTHWIKEDITYSNWRELHTSVKAIKKNDGPIVYVPGHTGEVFADLLFIEHILKINKNITIHLFVNKEVYGLGVTEKHVRALIKGNTLLHNYLKQSRLIIQIKQGNTSGFDFGFEYGNPAIKEIIDSASFLILKGKRGWTYGYSKAIQKKRYILYFAQPNAPDGVTSKSMGISEASTLLIELAPGVQGSIGFSGKKIRDEDTINLLGLRSTNEAINFVINDKFETESAYQYNTSNKDEKRQAYRSYVIANLSKHLDCVGRHYHKDQLSLAGEFDELCGQFQSFIGAERTNVNVDSHISVLEKMDRNSILFDVVFAEVYKKTKDFFEEHITKGSDFTEINPRLKTNYLNSKNKIHYSMEELDRILAVIGQRKPTDINHELSDMALIAFGGYGRWEVNLKSDIDLCIVCKDGQHDTFAKYFIFLFFSAVANIGIDRPIELELSGDCSDYEVEMKKDFFFYTHLLEIRPILDTHDKLSKKLETTIENVMKTHQPLFLRHKLNEMILYNYIYPEHENDNQIKSLRDVDFNIKDGPGGIREFHRILWILKIKHYLAIKKSFPQEIDNISDNFKFLKWYWQEKSDVLSDVEHVNFVKELSIILNFRSEWHNYQQNVSDIGDVNKIERSLYSFFEIMRYRLNPDLDLKDRLFQSQLYIKKIIHKILRLEFGNEIDIDEALTAKTDYCVPEGKHIRLAHISGIKNTSLRPQDYAHPDKWYQYLLADQLEDLTQIQQLVKVLNSRKAILRLVTRLAIMAKEKPADQQAFFDSCVAGIYQRDYLFAPQVAKEFQQEIIKIYPAIKNTLIAAVIETKTSTEIQTIIQDRKATTLLTINTKDILSFIIEKQKTILDDDDLSFIFDTLIEKTPSIASLLIGIVASKYFIAKLLQYYPNPEQHYFLYASLLRNNAIDKDSKDSLITAAYSKYGSSKNFACILATSKNTPTYITEALVNCNDDEIFYALAANPSIPMPSLLEMLRKAAVSKMPIKVMHRILENITMINREKLAALRDHGILLKETPVFQLSKNNYYILGDYWNNTDYRADYEGILNYYKKIAHDILGMYLSAEELEQIFSVTVVDFDKTTTKLIHLFNIETFTAFLYRYRADIEGRTTYYQKLEQAGDDRNITLYRALPFRETIDNKSWRDLVKYSIIGNAFDASIEHLKNLGEQDFFFEENTEYLPVTVIDSYVDNLCSAKNIVYITDNNQEIVFDLFLIKRLLDEAKTTGAPKKITIAGKDISIGGDATVQNIRNLIFEMNMNKYLDDGSLSVISSGSDIQGLRWSALSPKLEDILREKPLVVLKGLSNFFTTRFLNYTRYYLLLNKGVGINKLVQVTNNTSPYKIRDKEYQFVLLPVEEGTQTYAFDSNQTTKNNQANIISLYP